MKAEFTFENNSFDIIRIISAFFIVLGHIVTHLNAPVFKPVLYVQQRWVGLICLFVISGYVIPASLERSKSNSEYMKKRVVRIYPALWAATFISFMAIVVFGTMWKHIKYKFSDIIVWLVAQLTVFQFYTPSSIEAYGVGNPNGSLWTISMEIQVYILIMVLYRWLKQRNKREWVILIGGGIAFNALFSLLKPWLPSMVFKLVNVTFLPYAYIYLIGIFVYTFRQEMIPKLVGAFWPIAIIYALWSASNGMLFEFAIGHYVNIVSGVLICFLTLSGGYYFGRHRLKHDFSYSIYLYHMIVINALVVVGIEGNIQSIILVYAFTLLFSCFSVFVAEKYGAKLCKKILKIR